MYDKIVGGKGLIIGDIHYSDVFTGRHKSYFENCCWVLNKINAEVKENQPSFIILAGDLVGWTETNVRDRRALSLFLKSLKAWNSVCPVYAVRGNHDLKGYPDFMLFSDLGLIRTAETCGGYFDYYGNESQEVPEVRFHLVDYKSEDKELDIATNGASNIVIGHNNFTINGITTWYAEHDGIELGMMSNFGDVDMVISGHIHNPSPEIYSTQMPSGKDCMLFYPGCPTRPIKDKNMYDSCWYVYVEYNPSIGETSINPKEFKLLPASEIFYGDEEFIEEKTEEELDEEVRKEALAEVLGDLLKYRMNQGNPIEQIDNIPNASTEAKELAKRYLQTAFNVAKK